MQKPTILKQLRTRLTLVCPNQLGKVLDVTMQGQAVVLDKFKYVSHFFSFPTWLFIVVTPLHAAGQMYSA